MLRRRYAVPALLILLLLVEIVHPVVAFGADPQKPGGTPPSLFGLTGILPDRFSGIPGLPPVDWSRLAREAGARMNRWQFSWSQMEGSRGLVDLSSTDPIVEAAARNGFAVLGVLIGTPSWAGSGEASQVPADLGLALTHPDNNWARFVYNMVLHYRGQVRYWQIWNEPNVREFWSDSPEEYYRLLKVAYQAAKAADPTAQVVFGGLSGVEPGYLERVLRAGDADPEAGPAGYFFDVFAWHAYSRASQHYDGTNSYRDRLSAHGLSKPIWITESNIPSWNDPTICDERCAPLQWDGTLDEQASYVLQAFAYSLAAGVQHLSIYRASDVGEAAAWGLLQSSGTPRPANNAYATAARYLDWAESATLQRADGYDLVDVMVPGRRISALWTTGPAVAGARVEARGQQALLVDKRGNWTHVQPGPDGHYTLYLPAATSNRGNHPRDYVVGGEPYLLVQPR